MNSNILLKRRIHFTLIGILVSLLIAPSLRAQQSLSLDECRKKALQHNHRVIIASEAAQAANDIKKSAFTQFLPDVRFNGGYLHTNKNWNLFQNDMFLPIVPFQTIDPQTGQFNKQVLQDPALAMKTLAINPQTGQPIMDANGNPVFQQYALLPAEKLKLDRRDFYFAKFSVTQPIFTGFKIVETNNIARFTKEIANEKIRLTKAELLYQTDEAYWRVISLEEKVKLATSYEKLLDQLVSDLTNIYEEGMITRNDLLKAKVKQNEAKLKLLKARNGLKLSRMALAQIIGSTTSDIHLADNIDEEQANEMLFDLAGTTPYNIENRAEISMLKQKVAIAQSTEALSRSRFMPNIALTGGYGWLNPNPYNGLKKEFGGDWNIGVVVSMPIFHWGDRVHTLNAAKRQHQIAQHELEEAKEKINLQIQQAWFRYDEAAKKMELTQSSKQQAEENMQYAKENLSQGMGKLTDLLEAQLEWEKASSEHIDAIIETKITKSELDKATGTIYHYAEKYATEN